jgi:hypothetical protein
MCASEVAPDLPVASAAVDLYNWVTISQSGIAGAGTHDRYAEIAAKLVRLEVDVIVTRATVFDTTRQ